MLQPSLVHDELSRFALRSSARGSLVVPDGVILVTECASC
jgi:hypothetical protein